jgi:hypothetical protein
LLNSLPGTLWRARPHWPAPCLAAVNEECLTYSQFRRACFVDFCPRQGNRGLLEDADDLLFALHRVSSRSRQTAAPSANACSFLLDAECLIVGRTRAHRMQDRADREETIVVVLGGSLCGAAEYDLAAALRKAGSIFRRRTRSSMWIYRGIPPFSNSASFEVQAPWRKRDARRFRADEKVDCAQIRGIGSGPSRAHEECVCTCRACSCESPGTSSTTHPAASVGRPGTTSPRPRCSVCNRSKLPAVGGTLSAFFRSGHVLGARQWPGRPECRRSDFQRVIARMARPLSRARVSPPGSERRRHPRAHRGRRM